MLQIRKGRWKVPALGLAFSLVSLAAASVSADDTDRSMARLRHWNEVAMTATGFDHGVAKEQIGPGRSSRALAIIHIALFEVVNAVFGGHESYMGFPPALPGTSVDAAMAQAAHDTLVAMFPSQAATFDGYLVDEMQQLPADGKSLGRQLGRRAASRILNRRAIDGSQHAEPLVGVDFFTSNNPGKWRPDPISGLPVALGAFWGGVKPFVLDHAGQFLAPPPPGLRSAAYANAFNEVKQLGGDGVTQTDRTPDQTIAGIYWGYDGTPDLGAPPRLYNQIAMTIADQQGTGFVELARLLALVNVAMADAGIEIWHSKYRYQYWRPVAGIREADPGTGPTGLGDRNPATSGDETYTPLGAPMSNTPIENLTPPFPAYPSGHAGFGGALFEILRLFYGTDAIPFLFVSDEFNGVTTGVGGLPRPEVPRSFSSLSEAEEENGQSRIYLGIHWSFDKTAGIAQGRQVARWVFSKAFRPSGGVVPSPSATIDFNDQTGNRVLNGQYPASVVDWGTDSWWLAGPWGSFTTNSISFNGAGPTAQSFTFITPKRLISLKAYNGGSTSSVITVSCSGNPTQTVTVNPNELRTITTAWTAACTVVTIGSSNGWDTNFDDLAYDQGS